MKSIKLEFPGHQGGTLAAKLDLPEGFITGYALFAHCFTCSKDLMAVRRIAAGLARHGIALLRFDFTGLGSSEGEFASTNFSSNVADLKRAADYLTANYEAPQLLIGHSLGGAAVLAAAADIPGVEAVVTIGAPADVAHVLHNFGSDIGRIEAEGRANVTLGGREFTIERQFIDDARDTALTDRVAQLRKPLLILHAPRDATVSVDNASTLFAAARHPKSFVSLGEADHLLTQPEDAEFAANVIAGWAARYISAGRVAGQPMGDGGAVLVAETGQGKFQQLVYASGHSLLADEPKSYGGDETGPTPYDFVSAGLAACTSMTLRGWARRKNLDLGRISVEVDHAKVHAKDCADCGTKHEVENGKIDRFERRIIVEGEVSEQLHSDLLRIADLCPVHRTLESSSAIVTKVR